MCDQPGQPVQSLESFPELSVFVCIDDLGSTVIGNICWYTNHAFQGKTGPDNVPGDIPEDCFIMENKFCLRYKHGNLNGAMKAYFR